jgi:hypothetical protein
MHMKRISALALAAMLLSAPIAWGWCLNCTKVRPMPPQACGPCPEGCRHGLVPGLAPMAHVYAKIDVLANDCNFAHRVCAAEWLGCCLHADACRDPEVMDALFAALQCDKAWEVRRAAAIAIRHQHLICRNALMALYIASKTDPHFTVRFKAAESLDILTVPYAPACFKDLRTQGDLLVVELRKGGYRPGSDNCRVLLDGACSHCGISPWLGATPGVVGEVIVAPDRAPMVIPGREPELIAPPKGPPQGKKGL